MADLYVWGRCGGGGCGSEHAVDEHERVDDALQLRRLLPSGTLRGWLCKSRGRGREGGREGGRERERERERQRERSERESERPISGAKFPVKECGCLCFG